MNLHKLNITKEYSPLPEGIWISAIEEKSGIGWEIKKELHGDDDFAVKTNQSIKIFGVKVKQEPIRFNTIDRTVSFVVDFNSFFRGIKLLEGSNFSQTIDEHFRFTPREDFVYYGVPVKALNTCEIFESRIWECVLSQDYTHLGVKFLQGTEAGLCFNGDFYGTLAEETLVELPLKKGEVVRKKVTLLANSEASLEPDSTTKRAILSSGTLAKEERIDGILYKKNTTIDVVGGLISTVNRKRWIVD